MTITSLAFVAVATWLVPADLPDRRFMPNPKAPAYQGKFTFVRVEYDSVGGYGQSWYSHDGRDWERWETDYPEAEENLLTRMKELTTIRVNPNPISLRLTDRSLFDYPFIYMSDVGWQTLSEKEVERLRAYLSRGGFLWIDDFWGDQEWKNLEFNMSQVFPDLTWRTIGSDHPILSTVFKLDKCPQVPAKVFWMRSGESFDAPDFHRYPHGGYEGVRTVNFKGLFDEKGRLLAVATHNTDIGDGWERESEDKRYFEQFSTRSYAIGVNIIVYALTH